MAKKLTPKAAAALQRVVDKFRSGDLSAIVKVTRVELAEGVPAKEWSIRNKILVIAQLDRLSDCRTGFAWKQVGRWIRKGTHGVVIYRPQHIYETDELTGEKKIKFTCFWPTWRHPVEHTDGEPVESYLGMPKEPPPLIELAEKLGIKADWSPTLGELGHHKVGKQIVMGTADPDAFFHELSHAIHSALGHKKEIPGQDPFRETVAAFTACVLMHIYGYGDRSGNAWDYIKTYNPHDPVEAIKNALGTVSNVLGYIETLCEATT